MHAVRMPMMGNTMETGTVVEWAVTEGESVEEGDVVAVVESEKSAMDVAAKQDGTVARLDVDTGEEVSPGTLIGVILEPEENIEDAPPPRSQKDGASQQAETDSAEPETTVEKSQPAAQDDTQATEPDETQPVIQKAEQQPTEQTDEDGTGAFASPSTRRQARQLGVDIQSINGTGSGGRVTLADVREAAGQRATVTESEREKAATGRTSGDGEAITLSESDRVTVTERRELDGIRETIARRMEASHTTIPQVTLTREVPVDTPLRAASDLSDEVSVGFQDLLVAAVARALEEHPGFNARFDEDVHELVAEANIAVAVDTDAGLLTPVLTKAGARSVRAIASKRQELTERALAGRQTPQDMEGGTFTITNLGMFGVDSFDPIINPPQVAILGVGRIVGEGRDRTCTLNLGFDHRVVDGADAARFLDTVLDWLDAPSRLVTAQLRRADSEPGEELSPEPASGRTENVSEAIGREIERVADDIADTRDWSVSEFSADVATDGELSVNVSARGDSVATVRRLAFAACRDVGHEMAMDTFFDPALEVEIH